MIARFRNGDANAHTSEWAEGIFLDVREAQNAKSTIRFLEKKKVMFERDIIVQTVGSTIRRPEMPRVLRQRKSLHWPQSEILDYFLQM